MSTSNESIVFREDNQFAPELVCDFFTRFATWKVHTQPEKWERILSNSCAVISAWDGNSLIGFARGIGDQVRYAQVLDVLVHPNYRRRGIGKVLMSKLISHPTMQVRAVILGTPSMRDFYEAVGFQCVNDRAFFMVLVREEYGADLIQPIVE